MFAPHWTTSRVLQLSDVYAGHIFDNFLCLVTWSWLSCLQRIMFPKAAEVVWWGISATELHYKKQLHDTRSIKIPKGFLFKGPFSISQEPLGMPLRRASGATKRLGLHQFHKASGASWPLHRHTRDGWALLAACMGDTHDYSTLWRWLWPRQPPRSPYVQVYCTGNWQLAKPLQCFLEKHQAWMSCQWRAERRTACATPLFG